MFGLFSQILTPLIKSEKIPDTLTTRFREEERIRYPVQNKVSTLGDRFFDGKKDKEQKTGDHKSFDHRK